MYVLYKVESDCYSNEHVFALVGICKSVKHTKMLVQQYADTGKRFGVLFGKTTSTGDRIWTFDERQITLTPETPIEEYTFVMKKKEANNFPIKSGRFGFIIHKFVTNTLDGDECKSDDEDSDEFSEPEEDYVN